MITGTLDELKALLDDAITVVIQSIDAHVQYFFVQAQQLDPKTFQLEALLFNELAVL